jgi:hypothetical protein
MQEMQVMLLALHTSTTALNFCWLAEVCLHCAPAAVAYSCRRQHPDSKHESRPSCNGGHDPAGLPRVLLLGHPKVPIGLASALAQLPLGIKAAVTMPAQLMQLSSGEDGEQHFALTNGMYLCLLKHWQLKAWAAAASALYVCTCYMNQQL